MKFCILSGAEDEYHMDIKGSNVDMLKLGLVISLTEFRLILVKSIMLAISLRRIMLINVDMELRYIWIRFIVILEFRNDRARTVFCYT